MNTINLQAQQIWDQRYEDFQFFTEDRNQPVSRFMLEQAPATPGTCFEIGCFLGRYMALLGEEGWELNGIDLTPNLPVMEQWLKEKGFKTGIFEKTAIEDFNSDVKYDLVYSSGFIEHFTNFEEIISLHTPFVKKGGKLIITTPNFTGLQGILHRFFDPVNYKLHYIPSMNVKKWKKVLSDNGFRIDAMGPLGGFDFWVDAEQQHGPFKTKLQRQFMFRLHYLKRLMPFKNTFTSPYLGIAATRVSE